jgi:uncharacterized protein (DUF1499 family)
MEGSMSKLRDIWVRFALVLSLLVPVYFLVASLGTRFGLLDWRVGFGAMTFVWGGRVLLGAAAVAAVGLLLALLVPPRMSGWKSAVLALLIPLVGVGYGYYVRTSMSGVPPIHDVSTDLDDPPAFSEAVVNERTAVRCGNGLDLLTARVGEFPDPACALGPPGPPVVELHRAAYGDLRPIELAVAPEAALDAALNAARAQGWRVNTEDRAAGRIEATTRSFWYGFTDDIAIRVRPHANGSVVDVRSASRVGIGDMGANAKRIRAFRDALQA